MTLKVAIPETGPFVIGTRPDDRSKAIILAETVGVFRKWMHLPDPGALYVTLAAIKANHVRTDDPVWPFLVGAPGSGKTEVLNSVSHLPDIYPTSVLTEASLLSGTPAKDRAKNAKGGLLRQIGPFGIIVFKDFGSVLSSNKDGLAGLLAALREIYDGHWTRDVGTDGGQHLEWDGKIGLIAGVTPAIDSHHAVMGTMGERFVFYRIRTNEGDDLKQADMALQRENDEEMRVELAAAIAPVLADLDATTKSSVPDEVTRVWLTHLAALAARCRSAIDRDKYHREIEQIPEPEMPARLALVLWRLLRALRDIGLDEQEARRVAAKMAMDSMPDTRAQMFRSFSRSGAYRSTADIGSELNYPTNTVRRVMEDLHAHGVIRRKKAGSAYVYRLSDWTLDRMQQVWPDNIKRFTDDGG